MQTWAVLLGIVFLSTTFLNIRLNISLTVHQRCNFPDIFCYQFFHLAAHIYLAFPSYFLSTSLRQIFCFSHSLKFSCVLVASLSNSYIPALTQSILAAGFWKFDEEQSLKRDVYVTLFFTAVCNTTKTGTVFALWACTRCIHRSVAPNEQAVSRNRYSGPHSYSCSKYCKGDEVSYV